MEVWTLNETVQASALGTFRVNFIIGANNYSAITIGADSITYTDRFGENETALLSGAWSTGWEDAVARTLVFSDDPTGIGDALAAWLNTNAMKWSDGYGDEVLSRNYGFYLESRGGSATRFIDWRTMMSGGNKARPSNAERMDAILAGKAEHSKTIGATLAAGAWNGTEAPYTQTVGLGFTLGAANCMVALADSASHAQRSEARAAELSAAADPEDGSRIVVSADGEKPQGDIPVTILIFG